MTHTGRWAWDSRSRSDKYCVHAIYFEPTSQQYVFMLLDSCLALPHHAAPPPHSAAGLVHGPPPSHSLPSSSPARSWCAASEWRTWAVAWAWRGWRRYSQVRAVQGGDIDLDKFMDLC